MTAQTCGRRNGCRAGLAPICPGCAGVPLHPEGRCWHPCAGNSPLRGDRMGEVETLLSSGADLSTLPPLSSASSSPLPTSSLFHGPPPNFRLPFITSIGVAPGGARSASGGGSSRSNPVPIIRGHLRPVTQRSGVIFKVTLRENGWEERTSVRPRKGQRAGVTSQSHTGRWGQQGH